MQIRKASIVIAALSVLGMDSVMAQDTTDTDPRTQSQEERRAAREARREELRSMSDEERAAARDRQLAW